MAMQDQMTLPHKLTLNSRKELSLTGVTEVIRFDEQAVVLKTALGILTVHGQGLHLKNLSLEGGQAAVEGTVSALIYEEPRKSGALRRIFG
jgi:sporulation protein YabP